MTTAREESDRAVAAQANVCAEKFKGFDEMKGSFDQMRQAFSEQTRTFATTAARQTLLIDRIDKSIFGDGDHPGLAGDVIVLKERQRRAGAIAGVACGLAVMIMSGCVVAMIAWLLGKI